MLVAEEGFGAPAKGREPFGVGAPPKFIGEGA